MADIILFAGSCTCGAPARPVTLISDTGTEATICACDACRAETRAALDRVRPVQRALRLIGVSEDILTDVMLYLLDRIDEESTGHGP